MTVYADVLFAVNAAVDYLLIRAAAALTAAPQRRIRAVTAALLGGVFAVGAIVPIGFFHTVWYPILTFPIMAAAAFGVRPSAVRPAAVTLAAAFALAGLLFLLQKLIALPIVILRGTVYYPVTARVLILVSGLCYFLSALLFGGTFRQKKGELYPLTLTVGRRSIALTTLCDTGNHLQDHVSGRPVAVLTKPRFCELCGIAPSALPNGDAVTVLKTLQDLCPEGRFTLVPYHTVGTDRGLLPCVFCTAVVGRRKKAAPLLAALSPTPMHGVPYEALIGGQAL